jgi:hypothetical protein
MEMPANSCCIASDSGMGKDGLPGDQSSRLSLCWFVQLAHVDGMFGRFLRCRGDIESRQPRMKIRRRRFGHGVAPFGTYLLVIHDAHHVIQREHAKPLLEVFEISRLVTNRGPRFLVA